MSGFAICPGRGFEQLLLVPEPAPGPQRAVALKPVIVLSLVCLAVAFTLYYSLIARVGEERAALGNLGG